MSLLTPALAAQACPTQQAFTTGLTPSLRRTSDGWSATEFRYTAIQPTGGGRPRALDFFHVPSKVALELELSNQTCFSHDLLKLEVAFRASLISGLRSRVVPRREGDAGDVGGCRRAPS